MTKKILIAVGAVVVLLVVVAIGLALFLDANQFRPALAAKMTDALGRRVEIGSLRVSWLAGGVAAEDVVIMDDAKFSKDPFVSAKSVSIGVDLWPLIVSRSLRVQSFTLDHPRVALIRSNNGVWNFSSLGSGQSSNGSVGAISVLIQKIKIAGGQISIRGLDNSRNARSYDDVDVNVSNLSFVSAFPFTVSAKAPAGGSIDVDGEAGPFNLNDVAQTPFHGSVTIKHLDVAQTGFVDASSGIAAVVDFAGTVASTGTSITTAGKATATNVRLMPGATPSGVPIAVDYESSFNVKNETGVLKKGDVSIGKAVARLTGSYRTMGETTSLGMALRGDKMPVTELESALPAIGVTLPSGAKLTQGTLDFDLAITGPVDRLTIEGPIAMTAAKLTGFDLGEKMGAVASLAGVQRVGDTAIDSLKGMLQMTPAGIQITGFSMIAPSIGTLTGEGTISPQGAMNFPMLAKLRDGVIATPISSSAVTKVLSYTQTSGVPFRIQGTTKNPVFVPDVGRAVQGATDSLKDAAKNPDNLKKAADAIGGLFRK
ncbi:MAG TPA: AsmA family protein [Vicinamibacterales bacterium]|nr:AsmA family protein [Vicinamibacterales bacterium]